MGFFIGILICGLLIPLVMLIAGYCMWKHPPKNINHVVGYRTERSRKNQDTWVFAHHTCGRLWVKLGAVLLVLTLAAMLPFVHAGEGAIANLSLIVEGVQLAVLIASIVPVEKALKRTFDEYGRRR